MADTQGKTTVGLTETRHRMLQKLKEDGVFGEMVDGYRFAIALALAHGGIGDATGAGKRETMFNLGTLDPDQTLYVAISALRDTTDEPVYRTAERLAEWGIEELHKRSERGRLSLSELLDEVEALGV
jgi:hypothetical protein